MCTRSMWALSRKRNGQPGTSRRLGFALLQLVEIISLTAVFNVSYDLTGANSVVRRDGFDGMVA